MLPEPYTVQHQSWVPFDPPQEDAHGNPKGTWSAPVTRKAVAFRTLDTANVISDEFFNRTYDDVEMAVRDGSPYTPQDLVTVDGTVYTVNGAGFDYTKGLFPQYNPLLGTIIRLRRVT